MKKKLTAFFLLLLLIPMEVYASDCNSLLGSTTNNTQPAYYLNFIFRLMQYAAIVIFLVMTIIDLLKVKMSGKEEDLKKAGLRAVKRAAIAAIIFMLPVLLKFVLDVAGIISTDPTCGIASGVINLSKILLFN